MEEFDSKTAPYESEPLIKRSQTLDYLRAIEDLRIAVMGMDGWQFANDNEDNVMQDLSIDYYVGDEIMGSADAVTRSHEAVRRFLIEQLTTSTPFFSFTLDLPLDWKSSMRN